MSRAAFYQLLKKSVDGAERQMEHFRHDTTAASDIAIMCVRLLVGIAPPNRLLVKKSEIPSRLLHQCLPHKRPSRLNLRQH